VTAFTDITGSPEACGVLLGQVTAHTLRRRVEDTRVIQSKNSIPDARIEARVEQFKSNLLRVAPGWLEELLGMAGAAGVDPDDLLMMNCLPSEFYTPAAGNCTTFIEIGEAENRLFKIRDERNRAQMFYIHNADTAPRYQVGRDIGNLGIAHFLNEHGVAGANNTGSYTDCVSGAPWLNDCLVLRYFAEKAQTVDDIPELYRHLIDERVAGGAGEGRGAIYICADQHRGLILECVEKDCVATFLDHGTHVVSNHFLSPKARTWCTRTPHKNTVRRKERMEFLLDRHGRPPGLTDVFAWSRDRKHVPHALCNDNTDHFWMTISAQLHVIPRAAPEASVNYMCCGNTRHSLYIPVPLSECESFLPLLDGTFYEQADALYREYHCSPHMRSIQRRFEREIKEGNTKERTWYAHAMETLRNVANGKN
jgi:hypothetical protein